MVLVRPGFERDILAGTLSVAIEEKLGRRVWNQRNSPERKEKLMREGNKTVV